MKKRGRKPSKYRAKFWEHLPQATHRPIGEILEAIDNETKHAFATIARQDGSEVEALSVAVAKLPAYMKGLGYYLADAEAEVNLAKDDYEILKAKKEKALIADDLTVAKAEREAATDDEIILAKDKLRTAQHNFRVLKIQYDSTSRQVDGFRSRLTTVRDDAKAGV